MNKQKIALLSIVFVALTCCNRGEKNELSDVEIWKLGWRMIESSMEENYEIANLQFDSLRNITTDIDRKYLLTGLQVKNKIGKNTEVLEVLKMQNDVMLQRICESVFLSNLKPCQEVLPEEIGNKELQNELIKMYVDDQAVRGNVMRDIIYKYKVDTLQISNQNGVMVDSRNRDRLQEIFRESGFPTKKDVGKEAMNGIFLMIQHADGDKEWQKSQLKNIETAVKNGDMNGQNYAYLFDRIKINSNQKQRYGTQFAKVDPINGTVELAETEDLKNLDTRRREVGMMPIAMYKKFMLKNLPN
jgi:hypothetical protein